MRIVPVISVLFCLAAAKHHRHRVPVIDLNGAEQLTATIREDEIILNTVPNLGIVVESGPVCKYILSEDAPFDAEVIDRYTGTAVLKVKDGATLDCKKNEYTISVQAVRCDDETAKSEPVTVKVTVKDTNNHTPEFDSPWYTFNIEEGKVVPAIATLKAKDEDCGDPFGEICEYQITNALKDLPFNISNQGVLSNTQPLSYSKAKSYILTVVAIDCGMRQSKSSLVTINVQEACVQGIKNTNERIAYIPASGSKLLLPDALTTVCEKESACDVVSVESTITLKVGHVTKGCSRDTLYNNQTVQSCGLSSSAVKLLEKTDSSSSTEEESSGMTFDGYSNAVIVAKEKLPALIPDKFAFSFSMKHGKGSKEEQNTKQNIICETDDFSMNRHHFNVYVRHCKLEVVLRRENGATAEFRAAEWRWTLKEVCDNDWHSYSLLFNGVDDVSLMIDGKALKADERNPEILDDWPLHKTPEQKTKVVIGACWHGRQRAMTQFFKGQLAEIHLLTGSTESQSSVECAHRCPEQLQYTGTDALIDGQSAILSVDRSTLVLKSASAKEMTHMLRSVAYSNTQASPAPGHRSFAIETKAQCKQGKTVSLPVSKGYIFVQKPADPVISISGSSAGSVDHHNVKKGTPMLPDIKITVSQTNPDGSISDVTASSHLDYCKVHLKPSRDMDVEYFSSPASLIASMQIDFEHDKDGVLLRGDETVNGYLQVLSKIHYFNTRPENYNKRIYDVQCATLKGRVLSQQFSYVMTIAPPPVPEVTSLPTASQENLDSLDMIERHFEPAFDQLGSSRLQNIIEMDLERPKALMSHHNYDVGQGAMAGGVVAVIVVVCVGLLLVLLVVGVLKMRDVPVHRRRKNRKQDDGLHWDNSGMNITLNPLEDVEKNDLAEDFTDEESTDGESECSFRDEDEEISDEEEEHEVLPHLEGPRSGLEWDDEATLTPNSRSYRV